MNDTLIFRISQAKEVMRWHDLFALEFFDGDILIRITCNEEDFTVYVNGRIV